MEENIRFDFGFLLVVVVVVAQPAQPAGASADKIERQKAILPLDFVSICTGEGLADTQLITIQNPSLEPAFI